MITSLCAASLLMLIFGAVFMSEDSACPQGALRLTKVHCIYYNNTIVHDEPSTAYYDTYLPLTIAGAMLLLCTLVMAGIAGKKGFT